MCSIHFKQEEFVLTTGGLRKLKRGTVPSLFAWNHYTQSNPRANVWDRRPRCPPPPETSPSDSEMSETQTAHDHDYPLTLVTSEIAGELAMSYEELKMKVDELQNQLETMQLQCRFGLHRIAGSDENIRFYTRFVSNDVGFIHTFIHQCMDLHV